MKVVQMKNNTDGCNIFSYYSVYAISSELCYIHVYYEPK